MTLRDVTMGLAVDATGSADHNIKLPSGTPLDVGGPVPMSMGDCVDALAEVRALRIELEKRAKEVEKREDEIEEHIIASCTRDGGTGAVGRYFTGKIKPSRKAIIEDWHTFTAWVIKTGQTQVLYKRVNEKAVAEMEESKSPLPDGVGFKSGHKLSITKT